jgi:hypothetical protein
LLRIHSKKLEGADTDLCLREAYDVCAKAAIGFTGKFDREFTDVLLWQVIPAWILKHCSDEWLAAVPRRQRYEYLMKCVRGRIAHWQAEVVIPTRKEEGRSPLSDLWEAKKQLERLMDGPHEQVAEDFVRTNLALEYGIKPEEVTWKQILLEVERLSLNSDYPAVELVPTAPATDEAPGPYLFCRLLADMVDVSHVHLSAVLARWRSTIDKSSLRRALDTSPPILPPVTETRGYFALLARLSSATDESSPLEELDAAYCDHLLAFLGSHVSTPDEWWPPRELDTSPPGRAKSDELRRLTEGWLDEYRLDPRSPPPAQSEAGSSDRRKTGAEQTGSEVPATMKEADRFSADRGSGDVGSDTVMKEGIATPPGTAPYPKRAAWFEHELALREWSIHELQGQGGPDWKTSRKILDGLSVSRSVLEKTAAALSKKKKQVLFRDVPQE